MKQTALIFSILLLFIFSSCTTVGFHQKSVREKIDFGKPAVMKVCFFHEKDVSEKNINKIVKSWNKELNLYNIELQNAGMYPVKERPGYYNSEIFHFLFSKELRDPCDRLVYLRGRKLKDIFGEIAGLLLLVFTGFKFEVHGVVETLTNSRGIIKAKYVNLIQLIVTSPRSTMIHEGYHLLGCGHSLTKTKCYNHIKELKNKMNTEGHEKNFFPILTSDGRYLPNRDVVNYIIFTYADEQ